jgi:hypothetical protein
MGMVALGRDKNGGLVEVKPTFRKNTLRESIFSWYVVNIYVGTYIGLFFRDQCWWWLYKVVDRILDFFTDVQKTLRIPDALRWILKLDTFGRKK